MNVFGRSYLNLTVLIIYAPLAIAGAVNAEKRWEQVEAARNFKFQVPWRLSRTWANVYESAALQEIIKEDSGTAYEVRARLEGELQGAYAAYWRARLLRSSKELETHWLVANGSACGKMPDGDESWADVCPAAADLPHLLFLPGDELNWFMGLIKDNESEYQSTVLEKVWIKKWMFTKTASDWPQPNQFSFKFEFNEDCTQAGGQNGGIGYSFQKSEGRWTGGPWISVGIISVPEFDDP